MKLSNPISQAVLVSSMTAAVALIPTLGRADHCIEDWRRPVVCELDLEASVQGSDRRSRLRDDLRLEPGQTVRVTGSARDQDGRAFNPLRLYVGVELERHCDKLVQLRRVSEIAFELTTSPDDVGECQAWVYIPGNENLEWRLDLVVERPRPAPSRGFVGQPRMDEARARFIADCLYKAIFSRRLDEAGAPGAIAKLQAGELDGLLTALFKSPEFANRKTSRDAEPMLGQFYRGILGRDPDVAGSRGYLDDVRRGKYGEVIEKLLDSKEFQGLLPPIEPNDEPKRPRPFFRR